MSDKITRNRRKFLRRTRVRRRLRDKIKHLTIMAGRKP